MQVSLVRPHRWLFVCPCCGRQATVLYPPPRSGRPGAPAALVAAWTARDERGEVTLPDIPGDIGWACRPCRTGRRGSEASRMGPIDRLARAAAKADDPRRGMRRPGESWAQEARRERRIAEAGRRLVSLDLGAAGRLETFLSG